MSRNNNNIAWGDWTDKEPDWEAYPNMAYFDLRDGTYISPSEDPIEVLEYYLPNPMVSTLQITHVEEITASLLQKTANMQERIVIFTEKYIEEAGDKDEARRQIASILCR